MTELVPAATVVPLRDGRRGLEVLMLRRSGRGVFGGMWVFPGGQVEPVDLGADDVGSGGQDAPTLDLLRDPSDPRAVAAARRAAAREAKEEAALVLDPSSLVPRSFWVPPAETPRRFATWFFVAVAPDASPVVVDRAEIREHRWMTPAEAMTARDAGDIELVPPTFMMLWWLGIQPSSAAALAAASSRPLERFSTRAVTDAEGAVAATVWEGDAAYEDGDLGRPGRRRRLLTGGGSWRVEMDA